MTSKSLMERYANSSVLVAIVTLLGIIVGAAASHFFTKRTMLAEQQVQRSRALETQLMEYKKQAYSDFLQGQTLLKQGPTKEVEANQLISSAKLRIILVGSDGVLCSMAQYWAHNLNHKECPDPQDMRRDAAIYRNMRREFLTTLGVSEPTGDQRRNHCSVPVELRSAK